MALVPERPGIARLHRAALSWGEQWIPIPRVSPSVWSLLGLVGSAAYLYVPSPAWGFALVLAVLITDWYDGATARRFGSSSREGYLVDVAIDRFSEGLIFVSDVDSIPLARLFFVLFVVNTVLSLWGMRSGKHRILPLRALYLVVLFWEVVA